MRVAVCFLTCAVLNAPAGATPAYLRGRADTRAPGAGGNEMCPVKPDQLASEEFQIPFLGKRINFCCAECATKFKQHPRPHWVRLPQYSPYLALNWPDPNIDADRNRSGVNGYYRTASAVGGWGIVAFSVLLLPLGTLAARAQFKRRATAA